MLIYTMGFTKKSAEDFFSMIRDNNIKMLIDIRLNNQSQLAGFTKGRDIPFFLKEICDCEYSHEVQFAPTKDILDDYKKGSIDWGKYEEKYNGLMKRRNACDIFDCKYKDYEKVLLLCSEPTVDRPFEKLGRMSLDQVLEIHPLEKEDPIFGNYFGNIRKDLARGFGYSLILVEVSNLVIKTAKNNAGKNKRKADFIYQGKKYTDISMTDPNYINCEDGTCYKRAKLVISMGRPYGEGRNCYKFIAAIFVE